MEKLFYTFTCKLNLDEEEIYGKTDTNFGCSRRIDSKKGFEGTSVRDISAKANINVAMISYYFGSKEK